MTDDHIHKVQVKSIPLLNAAHTPVRHTAVWDTSITFMWLTFTWFLWTHASCAPQMMAGVTWKRKNYRQKYGGTFLSWGRKGWEDFLHFLPFLRTHSCTSSAQNLEVWGSSRWCRACPGKTWGICNPEEDLDSKKFNRRKTAECKLFYDKHNE